MTLETQTESALSDYVKKFLLEFKDENGNFRYVDDIDNMMPSKSKFINIDYNDLMKLEHELQIILYNEAYVKLMLKLLEK